MADAATEKQALTQVRALELEQQFWWCSTAVPLLGGRESAHEAKATDQHGVPPVLSRSTPTPLASLRLLSFVS